VHKEDSYPHQETPEDDEGQHSAREIAINIRCSLLFGRMMVLVGGVAFVVEILKIAEYATDRKNDHRGS